VPWPVSQYKTHLFMGDTYSITYRYIGNLPAAQQAKFKSLCTWRFLYIRIVFRLGCSESWYFVINSVGCSWGRA